MSDGAGSRSPTAPEPVVLVYHRISARPLCAGTWIGPEQLGGQIDALLAAGCEPLTGEQWREMLPQSSARRLGHRQGESSPGAPRRFLLTVDDGTTDLHRHRHVFQERGVAGVVFVPAALLGRLNRWELPLPGRRTSHLSVGQLRDLQRLGWEVGLHGATHRDLTRLPTDDLAAELDAARRLLAASIEAPVDLVSYPFGRVERRVAGAAAAAGFAAGFVVRRQPPTVARHLAWPRRPVYCIDTARTVLTKITDPRGRTRRGRWEIRKEHVAHGVGHWFGSRQRQR